jgi:hypothetical protein
MDTMHDQATNILPFIALAALLYYKRSWLVWYLNDIYRDAHP